MAQISEELKTASREASKKYGIPQSVILGFAGLETSFGTAGTGKSKNNLFGIMNSDGVAKSYATVTDSVEDFAKLVTGNKDSAQSQKYGKATANATTNAEWVTAITEAGYNSENAPGVYEDKVLNVIEYHNLDSYNTGNSRSGGFNTSGQTSGGSFGGGLTWWGDIVIVVFSIILILAGVVFIGLAVTNTTGGNPINKVKKAVKGAV